MPAADVQQNQQLSVRNDDLAHLMAAPSKVAPFRESLLFRLLRFELSCSIAAPACCLVVYWYVLRSCASTTLLF
jgi:hypothetical protein